MSFVEAKPGGLHVLIADDVATNRMLAEALLTQLGHRAVSVSNGAEAVELVRAEAFDLVLMDIDMPVMNGYAATRCIRSLAGESGEVPIFALTSRTDVGSQEEAALAGMTGFLSKPLRIDGLARAINEACYGRLADVEGVPVSRPHAAAILPRLL